MHSVQSRQVTHQASNYLWFLQHEVKRIFRFPWSGYYSIAGLTPADNSLLNVFKQGLKHTLLDPVMKWSGFVSQVCVQLRVNLVAPIPLEQNCQRKISKLLSYDKVKFIVEPQEWGYRYTIYYSKCSDLLEMNELFLRNTNRSMPLPSHDIKFSVYN